MTVAAPFKQPTPPAPAAPATSGADASSAYTPGGISSFQRVGFSILVLYLFLIYSRIFDVKFAFLHIPGISYRVIFAMVILSQAFVRALKTDVGKAIAGFTFWFVACIPFSMWKGGSTDLLITVWLPNFVVFLATGGLIANYAQCRKAVVTVAIGFLVLTAIAILLGSTESTGRLYLPNGKYANPNEMGQALLLGLSLWLFLLLDSKSGAFKAFGASVILVMLFTISKTGSRGCLIGLGVLLLAVFLRSSASGRLQLMLEPVSHADGGPGPDGRDRGIRIQFRECP